jgi:hypothetical protein
MTTVVQMIHEHELLQLVPVSMNHEFLCIGVCIDAEFVKRVFVITVVHELLFFMKYMNCC